MIIQDSKLEMSELSINGVTMVKDLNRYLRSKGLVSPYPCYPDGTKVVEGYIHTLDGKYFSITKKNNN